MKKHYYFLLILCILLVPVRLFATEPEIVEIPDTNFRHLLNNIFGQDPEAPITKEQLNQIGGQNLGNGFVKIDLSNQNITNFEGIQYFHPSNNYFVLSNNPLQNLNAVGKIPNLALLEINNNQLTSLNGLENATKLMGLFAENNQLNNVDALQNITTLRQVSLRNNPLTSVAGLANSVDMSTLLFDGFLMGNRQNKNVLIVSDNNFLSDLTFLTNYNFLPKIEQISVQRNSELTSLHGLENATNLVAAAATNNPKLTSLNGLNNASKLTRVQFENNQALTDISALANSANLVEVNIQNNKIKNLKGLENAANLRDLYAANNEINDVSHLHIHTYNRLSLDNNHIVDVSPIKGIKSTNHIDLSGNKIYDISPLSLSANQGDPNENITANEWVFMARQNIVMPTIHIDSKDLVIIKNPVLGFTSTAHNQLLNISDPNIVQIGDDAKKVLPYGINDENPTNSDTPGWLKYIPENSNMTVEYKADDNTLIYKNIPEDLNELKFDFLKMYWTGTRGVHRTPFSGTVTIPLNFKPVITANDITIQVGTAFNPLENVTINDKEDGIITVTSEHIKSNNVNTAVAGKYEVEYHFTDSHGAYVTKKIVVTVEKKKENPSQPDITIPEVVIVNTKLPATGTR